MNAFGDIQLSGTAKHLLERIEKKQIDMDTFLRDCAYWAMKSGFDELKPHDYPLRPTTRAFVEFEKYPLERKDKVEQEYFHKHPEINEYYNQKRWTEAKNKGTQIWLEQIKGYLPEEDNMLRDKIDKRLEEFKQWFDTVPPEMVRIRQVFDAKEIDSR